MKASELKCGDCIFYNCRYYFVLGNSDFNKSVHIISLFGETYINYTTEVKLITEKLRFYTGDNDTEINFECVPIYGCFDNYRRLYIKISKTQARCVFNFANQIGYPMIFFDDDYRVHTNSKYILDFSEIDKIEV